MRARQPFLSDNLKPRSEHGGAIRKGSRKLARPLDPKRAIHVVMRSTRARGAWSMLYPPNRDRIERIVRTRASKHGIRVYRFANVGNHLHLLVKAPDRKAFQAFLRSAAGTIAMAVTGGRKGAPCGRFWNQLAYSRLVSWGREFDSLKTYLTKNLFEAAGLYGKRQAAAGLRLIRICKDGTIKARMRP